MYFALTLLCQRGGVYTHVCYALVQLVEATQHCRILICMVFACMLCSVRYNLSCIVLDTVNVRTHSAAYTVSSHAILTSLQAVADTRHQQTGHYYWS
jgi:hypothetical protein